MGKTMRKCLDSHLVLAYIVIFAGCFMLFVYELIVMYSTNMNDFWFDFDTMILPTLQVAVFLFVIIVSLCTLFYFVNKIFDRETRIYKCMVLVGSLLYFATYIQGNWLTGNLPILDGQTIVWEQYGRTENLFITIIVVIIGIGMAVFVRKYQFGRTMKGIAMISILVSAMLSVSLILMVVGNDALRKKENIGFSADNLNNISENKNFIIFLVDAVDSGVFEKVLDSGAWYQQIFQDFTYYTDAASVFGFTRDSIPQILSGYINKNEKRFNEYSTDAYNNSKLFTMLDEEYYDINLYDNEIIWNKVPSFYICNAVSAENVSINVRLYMEQETKYILFKYLPYCLKKYSKIEGMDFYCCRECSDLNLTNPWIYDNIIRNSELEKQSANLFQYIHTEGAHPPFTYDKEINIIENGTYEEEVEASITIIDAFIQRLKENDAYDNSIIIIMADHGYTNNYTDMEILKRFNPILLVKGFDERHELIKSNVKVSYVDLPDVYQELIIGKKSTDLFKTAESNGTRYLLWYRYTKENHMIEYEIDGNMKETEKFRQTGNAYNR